MSHLSKDFQEKSPELQTTIVELGLHSWSLIEHYVDQQKNHSHSEYTAILKKQLTKQKEKEIEEAQQQKDKEYKSIIKDLTDELTNKESKCKKNFDEEKKILIRETKVDLEKEFQSIKEENIRLKTLQEFDQSLLATCTLQTEQINQLKQKVESLEKTKSSATIGIEGENHIQTMLATLTYDFEMTPHKSEKGDIRVTTKNGRVFALDSKKYKTNVGKKEKDKLKRDVDEDATVCGGLLISIDTKVTHQDHGDIIFSEHNKPILLISLMGMTYEAQKETINISIKILEQYTNLHEQKERADLVEKIKLAMSTVKESIQRFQNIEKYANKILEDAKAGLKLLEPLQKLLTNT